MLFFFFFFFRTKIQFTILTWIGNKVSSSFYIFTLKIIILRTVVLIKFYKFLSLERNKCNNMGKRHDIIKINISHFFCIYYILNINNYTEIRRHPKLFCYIIIIICNYHSNIYISNYMYSECTSVQ